VGFRNSRYAQQYEQRLGGAVDELKILVDDFDADAQKFASTGTTRCSATIPRTTHFWWRGLDHAADAGALTPAQCRPERPAGPDRCSASPISTTISTATSAPGHWPVQAGRADDHEGFMWAIGGFLLGYLIARPLSLHTLPLALRRGHQPHRRRAALAAAAARSGDRHGAGVPERKTAR